MHKTVTCKVFYREARKQLLEIHTKNAPLKLRDKDFCEITERLEGFSGSDIANVVLAAMFEPIRDMQTSKFWKYTAGTKD